MPYSACVRCAELRRLPLRRARQVGRRGARRAAGARAFERRRCSRTRRSSSSRRTPTARRSPRSSSSATARRRRTRPTSSCSPAARRTPRSCCSCPRTTSTRTGLANGSDQVGRNYMFHNSQAVLALSQDENPTIFQKTLGLNDFYFARQRPRLPAREHPDGRQVAGADVPRREAGRDEARAALDAGAGRQPRDRLLALDRGPADAREPSHRRRRREADPRLHGDERQAEEGALQAAALDARQAAHRAGQPLPPVRLHEERDPGGGRGPPGRDLPNGRRPGDVGVERRLPGARARQPLRRRHERLPEHRRGQPGADGDGELAARRRPPARADGRAGGGSRRSRPRWTRRESRSSSRSASSEPWSWVSAPGCGRTPSAGGR